jgi:hypothetical protein
MAPTVSADLGRAVKMILTTGLVTACYYADRPGDRPDCAHLAVRRHGPIALCSDCDRRRSAVGKAMVAVRLPDPSVLLELLAAKEHCASAEQALRDAVTAARDAGQPWSVIGTLLGTTRQAAQQRFSYLRRSSR